MELKFQVQTKIQKPVAEVFDAVCNPDKLSVYFTTGGASDRLEKGKTVYWAFADNPGDEEAKFPVEVIDLVENELLVMSWEGAKGLNTRIEMNFEATGPEETLVKIAETGWRETQQDLDSSYLNCFGWSQMVNCLKAYTEYGINLRKGAFYGVYSATDNKGGAEE